jgi:hypothetical protein
VKEYTTLFDSAKLVARFINLLARAYGLVQSFISLSIHHSCNICLQQILNMHHTYYPNPSVQVRTKHSTKNVCGKRPKSLISDLNCYASSEHLVGLSVLSLSAQTGLTPT